MSDTDVSLPAGNFSEWLRAMRTALATRGGMDVACADCRGCYVSSYYVKVRAHETSAAAAIGEANLEPGPPGDPGSRLMGFRDNAYKSLMTGTMAPKHHTKWMEAMDDSLESYLQTK